MLGYLRNILGVREVGGKDGVWTNRSVVRGVTRGGDR